MDMWIARVVNRLDDETMGGRVQVRIVGQHDDDTMIPDEDLPWAYPVQPVSSAALTQVGRSPTGLLEGSTVVGYWADQARTIPVVLGSMARSVVGGSAADNDVPNNSKGTEQREKIRELQVKKDGAEPDSSYAGRYPYVHTHRTESGHVLELDDTPGAERVALYHRSGTYVEVSPDGRVVVKCVADRFDVVSGDMRTTVEGNGRVTIEGDALVEVRGDTTVTADGDVTATVGGDLSVTVGGSTEVQSGGDLSVSAGGSMALQAAGTIDLTATGKITLAGSEVEAVPCIHPVC
jgi:hypothetical protein